jgi:dTDP-4-amino-4,6-dideoxygalactose transaminase
MDEALSEVPGIRLLRRDPRHTSRAVYCYTFAIEPEKFGANNHTVCAALYAEGIQAWPGYTPMNKYDLFQPQNSRLPVPSAFPERFNFSEMHFAETERAYDNESMWLGEGVFRSGKQGVDDVVNALKKIQAAVQHEGVVERIQQAAKE